MTISSPLASERFFIPAEIWARACVGPEEKSTGPEARFSMCESRVRMRFTAEMKGVEAEMYTILGEVEEVRGEGIAGWRRGRFWIFWSGTVSL